jgi:hypothetical protein
MFGGNTENASPACPARTTNSRREYNDSCAKSAVDVGWVILREGEMSENGTD